MTIPNPETEPTITVERMAKLLGLSRGSAYQAVRAGELPAIRVGRRWVVPTAAVLTILGVADKPNLPSSLSGKREAG